MAQASRLQLFINQRCRELGIPSQRELSRLMGRDESAVNKIITRGSSAPTAELVRDLAVVLRVPLEEVYWALGLTETKTNESQIEQQEILMIYDHLDEERRRQFISYGEFLLTQDGHKSKRNPGPTE